MTTWTLTPAEYSLTVEKVAKINARAAKRGFTGRIDVTGERIERTEVDEVWGVKRTRVFYEATITGEAPSYNGWRFMAAVDTIPAADGGENFIVNCAPGIEDERVDRSALVAGRCEHCGTAKANRKYTYLVQNVETGEYKQVGSTCIKDFTGWQGIPVFLSVKSVEDDLDFGFGGYREFAETVATVVGFAYAAVRAFGWAPASGFDTPTKTRVEDAMAAHTRVGRETLAAMSPFVAEGMAKAQEILDTVIPTLKADFGYEANLRAALTAEYVLVKQFGLVVSAVSAYDRILERAARDAAKAKADADRPESHHIGQVKERLTLKVTVVRVIHLNDSYAYSEDATKPLYKMVDEQGNDLAWFASDYVLGQEPTGEQITLVGTVKKHEEYQGRPQTVLTRCKAV